MQNGIMVASQAAVSRRRGLAPMEGTKIARLWKYTTKNGRVYFSGPMTKITRLVIVENTDKQDDDDPDYYAYVVPNRGPRPFDDALDEP